MGIRTFIAEHNVSAVVETSVEDVIDLDQTVMAKIVKFNASGFYQLGEREKLLQELTRALPTL